MIGRALLSAGLPALLLAAVAATAVADSGPSATTFSDVVNSSRLIVLADIAQRSDGGFDLAVERVLKGSAASTLRFPATPSPAVQPGWRRAVVAFTDPTTIDSRAVTIAWHVAVSGALDPERYQQYPGTPQTLAALLAWFGRLPATDAQPASTAAAAADWRPLILVLAGLAGLAGATRRTRTGRRSHRCGGGGSRPCRARWSAPRWSWRAEALRRRPLAGRPRPKRRPQRLRSPLLSPPPARRGTRGPPGRSSRGSISPP